MLSALLYIGIGVLLSGLSAKVMEHRRLVAERQQSQALEITRTYANIKELKRDLLKMNNTLVAELSSSGACAIHIGHEPSLIYTLKLAPEPTTKERRHPAVTERPRVI